MSEKSSPGLPERTGSVPTTFTPAPFATRPALPGGTYPTRTVDEMTEYERPPVVAPRESASLPITRTERRVARAMDLPNNWHLWADENDPVRTSWRGHDLSWAAQHGDVEDPNETAAVESETVTQSIELGSDPLVAMRRMARDSQTVIRRQLDTVVELENTVQRQTRTIDRLREQRNQLLVEVDEVIRERDSAEQREDALHMRQNGLESQRDEFESQRNQYLNDRDHYRGENRTLHAELRDLTAQLTAARALLANQHPVAQLPANAAPIVQPPVVQPPVNAAPIVQPPVVQPPVAVDPAGAVRGGRGGRARGPARGGARGGPRGRAGRGGRGGGAPTTREQPGRSCKVVKNYKQ